MSIVRVDILKKPKRRILKTLQKHIFQKFSWTNWAVGKGGPDGVGGGGARRKIGKCKIFTCDEHLRLWFIYWARHKWQKVDSFYWICHFSPKLSYHCHQPQLCKFLFLIRTLVKANNSFHVWLFVINIRS